ncbi:uncharacterized protein LOC126902738 [Daktulosphaira vitifoliae]|uniref:uncharacterized protein LOC126902738 n=1 Tax=Daktulosphaira vitifoliae TaxID=58002 RepID=UPI0021A9D686|nr:uncharacterized protein LOC126902738 [Daktulosphaira vitifoliae]
MDFKSKTAAASDLKIEDESDDGVYIRPSKKKIMTSQIVTNDELTNLIQERLANRRTGERTEFANQLARKLIKKLHDKDEKIRKIKGKKRRSVVAEIKNEKSGHLNMKIIKEDKLLDSEDSDTPVPSFSKKSAKKKKRETSKMSGKEIAMTILNCKEIDKKVAIKFTSTLKSRLANKLKKNSSASKK